MNTIRKGGRYLRVCDPTWIDPCDPTYSARAGGRWNTPGAFPVLYLNATLATARANAERIYDGEAFGLMDLNPTARPHLQIISVASCLPVDAFTDAGLTALGLPTTYPNGIGHDVCQPIGQQAYDDGHPGIACRSAALPGGEELALFDQSRVTDHHDRLTFDAWYLSTPVTGTP